MCLQSKWIFPRRATKDIVCYKVLVKGLLNDILYTPYQNFCVGNIEELPITVKGGKHKPIKQSIENIRYICNYYSENIISSIMCELKCKENGYIHAFCNIYNICTVDRVLIVTKCIIPKGTLYHISYDESEICARKMIISEIIKL